MTKHADTLIVNAHTFTMQGEGVGYVAGGAVAVDWRAGGANWWISLRL